MSLSVFVGLFVNFPGGVTLQAAAPAAEKVPGPHPVPDKYAPAHTRRACLCLCMCCRSCPLARREGESSEGGNGEQERGRERGLQGPRERVTEVGRRVRRCASERRAKF
jgi:hypothetical protein